ncbi:aminotransferase class I/II-fold pyridoxal phosphate-dependent enzyme [Tessaracoccus sp. MC1756]|uniref:aminotransferase class I/II-fold pyridoxal phosphate-dependent enzyme n=1 Tax=Tessaracoccus sp. MC1756 TaxID=2760311 RepID=UPI001600E6A5|nr:aminotransferase class I/II-fold pyridoxal phosphate-dependent enzyme [Tessaracoccus sp. MC1756]MBB1508566.1 aminotransferase class I/II-fold pyridoxal phosphate-dependent enzyme [Tessaracoccus sp. MC1756]
MPSRRSAVPPFEVMTVLDRVATMRAGGRDVISLCAGEPAGGAPAGVTRAAASLHASGRVFGYTSALGIWPLRVALAEHYRRWYGLDIDPAQVAVTTGSSGGFLLTFLAAFEAGDRVALARPGYPAYRNILTSLGCEVVDIECGADVRFQPTVEQLAATHAERRLQGLILASPANPTGTMVNRDELGALVDWCRSEDVRLISDEIYHGVTYPVGGHRGTSAWELSEDAVVVSSFSKYWGMTGWRIGWLLLPADLADAVDALAGNLALCPPAPAQYAALEAFTDESYAQCDVAVAGFAEARGLLLAAESRLNWGVAAPADGAFYYYADLGPQLERWPGSGAYASALLEAAGVAVTPGRDFDTVLGDRTVRLSFAAGATAVAQAIERIVAFQS